jgi:hypothetical protein
MKLATKQHGSKGVLEIGPLFCCSSMRVGAQIAAGSNRAEDSTETQLLAIRAEADRRE